MSYRPLADAIIERARLRLQAQRINCSQTPDAGVTLPYSYPSAALANVRRNWPYIELPQGNISTSALKLAMSGASDEGWVLVAAPQPAASEARNDDATVATAATAATVPSHEETVARGQSMAATASADAAEVRPFDRLPDDGLAKVLAVLKQSEHRRVESVCQRWRQIRPRASTARVKSSVEVK